MKCSISFKLFLKLCICWRTRLSADYLQTAQKKNFFIQTWNELSHDFLTTNTADRSLCARLKNQQPMARAEQSVDCLQMVQSAVPIYKKKNG